MWGNTAKLRDFSDRYRLVEIPSDILDIFLGNVVAARRGSLHRRRAFAISLLYNFRQSCNDGFDLLLGGGLFVPHELQYLLEQIYGLARESFKQLCS